MILMIVAYALGDMPHEQEQKKMGTNLFGQKLWYVYGLKATPTEKFGTVYFYIGYTDNPDRRLKEHKQDNGYGLSWKAHYIRRVQEQGGDIEMTVLERDTSEKRIREKEKKLIKKYGLTNMRIG